MNDGSERQDGDAPVMPDRLIEQDTLRTDGVRSSIEVRIPWYRALPASCISGVELSVDGIEAPQESIRWTMNGHEFRLDELPERVDEWWYPADSAVVTADLPVSGEGKHRIDVELKLFIPYIMTDQGVLEIHEHDSKEMEAATNG